VARSTRPDLPAASKAELHRLRTLLRDRSARDDQGVFVCEGPRVLEAALEHGAELLTCYVASGEVYDLAERTGAEIRALPKAFGDTVTPQPILALARLRRTRDVSGLDLAIVGTEINDPGNAGTLIRSAAAAGAQAVIFGAGSVDAYNPKVVRASAGACFAIRIVEGVPAVEILEALGADGVRRVGAAVAGGKRPEDADLRARTALVLGHEVHGLDAALPLDEIVTLPMTAGESVNVAMAGTALLFEAARQRRST
jgi:TrmH family RNA methyltransferase